MTGSILKQASEVIALPREADARGVQENVSPLQKHPLTESPGKESVNPRILYLAKL